MDNLVTLLDRSERTALAAPDGSTLSYRALGERVDRLAGGLFDLGVRPGDRIVVLLPMGFDLYISLLALFHIGATAVLVDPSGPVAENLAVARPGGLIGVPMAHLLRLKVPALRGLPLNLSAGFAWLPHRRLDGVGGSRPPVDPGRHPALLTFTTGTTGKPKGMARSHAMLLAQHHALLPHMPVGPGEVDLPTLPVFLLHALAGGATCVIADADLRAPGSIDGARLLAQMRTQGVTSCTGSPALFARLVSALEAEGKTLRGLQRAYLGGARVPARLLARMVQRMPDTQIFVVYGSTEAEPIAFLDARSHLDELLDAEARGRGALVGKPVFHISLRFEDDEILVAGDHVNPGYFEDPEADARTKIKEPLPDGGTRTWHRTGDAGFLDDQGRVWLVGRVGERVAGHWPLQVEGAAEQLPFVTRAGLAEKDGRPVVACALIDPPSNWAEQVQAATGLAPLSVAHVPVDPRHNAKVDRAALAELLR